MMIKKLLEGGSLPVYGWAGAGSPACDRLQKIEAECGFRPTMALGAALRSTIAWYLDVSRRAILLND
jgi:dTDP-D-glucose 4,6-dehydratase